jgi:DNA-binding beta-propeller fold protein YncE
MSDPMTALSEREEPMHAPLKNSTATRTWRRSLIALVALSLWAVFAAAPAQASFDFVTKWGSAGSGDGQFGDAEGVATDAAGNVYVADASHDRIQKFSSSGGFLAKWGSLGSGDGQFNNPDGVATDAAGNVYVTDRNNHRIEKFTSSGAFVKKWGSLGSGDGQFDAPELVATDAAGNVYVADSRNDRIQKFTASGLFLTKWGSTGSGDGQFSHPFGVATDGSGNVYVTDGDNDRVQKFTGSGLFLTKWGSTGSGDRQFNAPGGIATDPAGDVYVADYLNNRIQKFSPSGGFLFRFGSGGAGDGQFFHPLGVATDCRGNVYVSDDVNARIQKFGETTAPAPPCSSTAGSAQPSGAGSTASGLAADTTPPSLTLAGARRQRVLRQRGVIVFATSSEAGKFTAAGRFSVPKLAKVFRFKPVSRTVGARQRAKLSLKLSKTTLAAIRRALARGQRLTAKITVTARDGAGNKRTSTRRVRLVR